MSLGEVMHGSRCAALVLIFLSSGWAVPRARAQAGSGAAIARTSDAKEQDMQARAFFDIGAQAYDIGDYAAALDAFGEAYSRAARPGLLFSMAQAHRRVFFATNDQAALAHAIEHYRKYLASGDKARRKDAEEALAQLVLLADSEARPAPASERISGTKLMVTSATPGAVLHIDGVEAPHLPHVAAVTPGTHKLTLSAPGYQEQVREVPVPAGTAFALEISLEGLPGKLSVDGLAGSQLWADGRLIGVMPVPPLALKAGPHQVSLRKPGYRISTRMMRIEGAKSERVALPLVPTVQRRVSIGVLWASAATLLAGAGTALGAFVRERSARTLRSRLDTERGKPFELTRYNEALTDRDRLRWAAIGLAGATAGLALLGTLLFFFDRPEVPALLDQESGRGGVPHKLMRVELLAGPSSSGQPLGLEVSGRF